MQGGREGVLGEQQQSLDSAKTSSTNFGVEAALNLAAVIADKSPVAVLSTKHLMNRQSFIRLPKLAHGLTSSSQMPETTRTRVERTRFAPMLMTSQGCRGTCIYRSVEYVSHSRDAGTDAEV